MKNLEQSLEFQKYNIKEKKRKKKEQKKSHNNYITYTYEVCFKKQSFFCKVIVDYKSEN